MKKIVLISCVKAKKSESCIAIDFYISPWFKRARDYAKYLCPDEIYILSAEYGLVYSKQILYPYEKTLNNMKFVERKIWAQKVILQMKDAKIDFNDEIIFLAGAKYRENIINNFPNAKVPMKGLGIGKQLQFMDNYKNNQ
jgi:hypothetical protein